MSEYNACNLDEEAVEYVGNVESLFLLSFKVICRQSDRGRAESIDGHTSADASFHVLSRDFHTHVT